MESRREQYHHSTLLISVILCLVSTSFSALEFDYIEGSNIGPKRWGELKGEWAQCKNGRMQSPIALTREIAILNKGLGQLNRSYKPGNATLTKSGYDVSVEWEGNAGSIQINGTNYLLQEFHWHHPSEHTINGQRYELELHMVHTNYGPNVTNNVAVVAVLYKRGPSDLFLSTIATDIRRLNNEGGKERRLRSVNPGIVIINREDYYMYIGSLTTPPCSQGVIWTVGKQIRSVSSQQVDLLKNSVEEDAKMNARPLQERDNRDVFVYEYP